MFSLNKYVFLVIAMIALFATGCSGNSQCVSISGAKVCSSEWVSNLDKKNDELIVFKSNSLNGSVRFLESAEDEEAPFARLKLMVSRFFSAKEVPYTGQLSSINYCNGNSKPPSKVKSGEDYKFLGFLMNANSRGGFPSCSVKVSKTQVLFGYHYCNKSRRVFEIKLYSQNKLLNLYELEPTIVNCESFLSRD